ncbi:MAG TPA: hypothetical protein VFG47_07595 [Geminicoccaceae bacterium]|nr:hypothetical protein [Geminicoccaceae bacterium]
MAPEAGSPSFLDRPLARAIALACFGLCAAALVYIHRDDIWPQPAAQAGADPDDPVVRCFAERSAQIDDMVGEGVIGAEQATLFKSRAEALCRAQEGGAGAGPPGLPGGGALPPGVRPPGQ